MIEEKHDNGVKSEAPQWLVNNISEASKNTRKIYLLYMGFLAYCALTVISTTDRTLILNEQAYLPIINFGVPLEGFFIFAPILAIMMFVYLQIYLQRLNSMKLILKRDYKKVSNYKLYPWIINFEYLEKNEAINVIHRYIISLMIWWFLPLVLLLFALKYAKKHDIVMSYILGLLPIFGMITSFWFRSRYFRSGFFEFLIGGRIRLLTIVLFFVYELFFLIFLIPWSMAGGKYDFLKPWLCVDLSYQKLIIEPETDYKDLYWADFSKVHLEGANLTSTILKRSDLSYAHLEKAVLNKANLTGTDLSEANMQNCEGRGAILDSVDLYKSDLSYSVFRGASFQGTLLDCTRLQGVDLTEAKLNGALLRQSNVERQYTMLDHIHELLTDYDPDSVVLCTNLQNAILLFSDLKDCLFSNVNLREVDLRYANLQGSAINMCDLRGANLEKTNLLGTTLIGTNLQGVENLEIEQLSKVRTLYMTRLDPVFLDRIKSKYPHLLEFHME